MGASATSVPPGYKLFFVDDFNGTSINTSSWRAYHNTYGDGNQEEACLTPDNVVVSGGTVKITAKREARTCPNNRPRDFTSGFLGSRDVGKYYPVFARYEIRAKLPHGQGLWPAFWLRHVNGSSTAEVDIMEYFHVSHPGQVKQTLHLPAEQSSNVTSVVVPFESPTTNPGWHTFATEIVPLNPEKTSAKLVFYVNGTKTNEYTPTVFGWLNNFDKNAMFDMAINLAVGGRWNGHPDDELGWSRYLSRCLNVYNRQSPCDPVGGVQRATFPDTYEVDYVRVLTIDDTPPPGGTGGNPPQPPTPTNPTSPPPSSPNPNTGSQVPINQPVLTRETSQSFAPEVFEDEQLVEQIVKVEYLLSGEIIQTYTQAPYDLITDSLPPGEHEITQRITFEDGRVTESVKNISIDSLVANTPADEDPSIKRIVVLGLTSAGLAIITLVWFFRHNIKAFVAKKPKTKKR